MLPNAAELDPYVLARVEAGDVQAARWRLADGKDALAVFSSKEKAEAYRTSSCPGTGWRVVQPTKIVLLDLFRACSERGVKFVVLDPEGAQAKLVFALDDILSVTSNMFPTGK